jgi:hypothetical protein
MNVFLCRFRPYFRLKKYTLIAYRHFVIVKNALALTGVDRRIVNVPNESNNRLQHVAKLSVLLAILRTITRNEESLLGRRSCN